MRLGCLLRYATAEQRAAVYDGLRLSNGQRARSEQTARLLKEPWQGDEVAARRRLSQCRTDAALLTDFALSLGIATEAFASHMRQSIQRGDPVSIRALAVNGKELAALGIRGEQTGRVLARLLDLVIEDPARNEQGCLLRLAAELIKNKEV